MRQWNKQIQCTPHQQQKILIMGDTNATVGNQVMFGGKQQFIFIHSTQHLNQNGERLLCTHSNLRMNTYLEWILSSKRQTDKIKQNIEYAAIRKYCKQRKFQTIELNNETVQTVHTNLKWEYRRNNRDLERIRWNHRISYRQKNWATTYAFTY